MAGCIDPVPPYDGCAWPCDPACFEDTWDDLDPKVQDRSLAFASATLRRLTGYRVGGCPITVRPCKQGCTDLIVMPAYTDMLSMGYGLSFWPYMNTQGLWVNSCGCATACSCEALCSIHLPAPVGRVDRVMLDGVELAPDTYRVDGTELVWLGDDCPFPTCQDMTLPGTEPGTFSITYLNGYPVDGLGAYAAGVLAMEYAKACTGGKCRLPAGVTSVARQGVSLQIATGAFPGGMTGIREVDSYIALYNPKALTSQATVWTPGRRVPRVVGS